MNNFWFYIDLPISLILQTPEQQYNNNIYIMLYLSIYIYIYASHILFAHRQNILYRIIPALKLFNKEITTLAARDPRQMVL